MLDPRSYWNTHVDPDWEALASYVAKSDELVTTYFEEALLEKNERRVDQVLKNFDPTLNQIDEILFEGITGYKAGGGEYEPLHNFRKLSDKLAKKK